MRTGKQLVFRSQSPVCLKLGLKDASLSALDRRVSREAGRRLDEPGAFALL
jgi:hypothetical protein